MVIRPRLLVGNATHTFVIYIASLWTFESVHSRFQDVDLRRLYVEGRGSHVQSREWGERVELCVRIIVQPPGGPEING